jgi:hypothetical protein
MSARSCDLFHKKNRLHSDKPSDRDLFDDASLTTVRHLGRDTTGDNFRPLQLTGSETGSFTMTTAGWYFTKK